MHLQQKYRAMGKAAVTLRTGSVRHPLHLSAHRQVYRVTTLQPFIWDMVGYPYNAVDMCSWVHALLKVFLYWVGGIDLSQPPEVSCHPTASTLIAHAVKNHVGQAIALKPTHINNLDRSSCPVLGFGPKGQSKIHTQVPTKVQKMEKPRRWTPRMGARSSGWRKNPNTLISQMAWRS